VLHYIKYIYKILKLFINTCTQYNVVDRPRAVPREKRGTADNTSRNEIRPYGSAPLHKHYLYPIKSIQYSIGTVNVMFIYKINIQSGNYL
jgi:hypothetical protein